jgi:hypothetical protein
MNPLVASYAPRHRDNAGSEEGKKESREWKIKRWLLFQTQTNLSPSRSHKRFPSILETGLAIQVESIRLPLSGSAIQTLHLPWRDSQ